MDVFIYFPLGLPVDRDEVEDELEAALEGVGEVTGGGSGKGGSNVDLEVVDSLPQDQVLFIVRRVLERLGLKQGKIVINRQEFPVVPPAKG